MIFRRVIDWVESSAAKNEPPGKSTRIALAIPVMVSGKDKNGKTFKENTQTTVVERQGGTITLTSDVLPGAEILIENPAVGQSALAKVVRRNARRPGQNSTEFSLELVEIPSMFDNGSIWGLKSPPRDWTQPADRPEDSSLKVVPEQQPIGRLGVDDQLAEPPSPSRDQFLQDNSSNPEFDSEALAGEAAVAVESGQFDSGPPGGASAESSEATIISGLKIQGAIEEENRLPSDSAQQGQPGFRSPVDLPNDQERSETSAALPAGSSPGNAIDAGADEPAPVPGVPSQSSEAASDAGFADSQEFPRVKAALLENERLSKGSAEWLQTAVPSAEETSSLIAALDRSIETERVTAAADHAASDRLQAKFDRLSAELDRRVAQLEVRGEKLDEMQRAVEERASELEKRAAALELWGAEVAKRASELQERAAEARARQDLDRDSVPDTGKLVSETEAHTQRLEQHAAALLETVQQRIDALVAAAETRASAKADQLAEAVRAGSAARDEIELSAREARAKWTQELGQAVEELEQHGEALARKLLASQDSATRDAVETVGSQLASLVDSQLEEFEPVLRKPRAIINNALQPKNEWVLNG
jgi:hypothetical protein